MLTRASTRASTQASIEAAKNPKPKVKPQAVVSKCGVQAQKRTRKSSNSREYDPDFINNFLSEMEGVYELNDVYYMVWGGEICHFNTKRPVKSVTVAFLRRLKLCKNSDLLVALHDDIDDTRCENYAHISSDKYKLDNFCEIVRADDVEVTVNVFDQTVSVRENGTRTYDTEYGEPYSLEWKYVDNLETMSELPWWTDSEPDSDDEDDEDEDSDDY